MSNIKLFRYNSTKTSELPGRAAPIEKSLQNTIEQNLEPLLGIRFVATEYQTGKVHTQV